jgi:uncharacterized protein DUF5681
VEEGKAKDYEVGYGRPPRAARFKKGRSGNPKGRPKGSKNFATLLREALSKKVEVRENGRRRKITKLAASAAQLANKVAMADTRTLELVLNNPALYKALQPRVSARDQNAHHLAIFERARLLIRGPLDTDENAGSTFRPPAREPDLVELARAIDEAAEGE